MLTDITGDRIPGVIAESKSGYVSTAMTDITYKYADVSSGSNIRVRSGSNGSVVAFHNGEEYTQVAMTTWTMKKIQNYHDMILVKSIKLQTTQIDIYYLPRFLSDEYSCSIE